MNLVIYLLAAGVGFLGLVFLVGSQGQMLRIVIGIVLMVAGLALVLLTRIRPRSTTLVQKLDLSGNVNLQNLHCRQCGGALSKKSISVQAGAVFIQCEYCGAAYQLEEDPKW